MLMYYPGNNKNDIDIVELELKWMFLDSPAKRMKNNFHI